MENKIALKCPYDQRSVRNRTSQWKKWLTATNGTKSYQHEALYFGQSSSHLYFCGPLIARWSSSHFFFCDPLVRWSTCHKSQSDPLRRVIHSRTTVCTSPWYGEIIMSRPSCRPSRVWITIEWVYIFILPYMRSNVDSLLITLLWVLIYVKGWLVPYNFRCVYLPLVWRSCQPLMLVAVQAVCI